MNDDHHPSCPQCGTPATPVHYGLPAAAASEQAARGEIVVGGGVLGAGSPRWACTRCDTRFGDIRPLFSSGN
ncbi:hypothetical protein [Nocardia jejuensis]|uniref:hypothetical protein n=1 Tax=Nocardia jejuensis TaxID=328049 RepID=UPI000AD94657|nr:hypothetical protein [Nocardia jejuensis]